MKQRQEKEMPLATGEWGWKFHHLGVPTTDMKHGEKYLQQFKFSVSGFYDSPFGVEWMRFEEDCEMPELIKTVPHLAFVVDDLDHELTTRGFHVIVKPNPPMKGVRVAMIEHHGAPIELMEFEK
jgi:hypothetical protein